MRPVNLLPDDLRPRRAAEDLRGSSYAVIGLLAVVLVMAVAYVLTANQVNSRKSEIAQAEQETAEAQARAARLAPYQNFAQIKAARVESVKQLAGQRFDWERMMREVALVLPADTSLTDLHASTVPEEDAGRGASAASTVTTLGPSLNLKGCAKRQPDVATLMVRLRRLYRATDVQLTESSRQGSVAGGVAPSSGTVSDGCSDRHFAFDVTVGFEQVELEQPKRVPARLGGGA